MIPHVGGGRNVCVCAREKENDNTCGRMKTGKRNKHKRDKGQIARQRGRETGGKQKKGKCE